MKRAREDQKAGRITLIDRWKTRITLAAKRVRGEDRGRRIERGREKERAEGNVANAREDRNASAIPPENQQSSAAVY